MRIEQRTAIALFVLLAAPCVANTTELPEQGGNGGERFRSECAPGSFLIGMQARHGDWIDQVRPVCATVDENMVRGPGVPLADLFGGQGGDSFSATQCEDGLGMAGMSVSMITDPGFGRNTGVVHSIRWSCHSVIPPYAAPEARYGVRSIQANTRRNSDILFDETSDSRYFHLDFHECPPGELAVGIWGHAGVFVDAIGLICGPGPRPAEAPPPQTQLQTSVSSESGMRLGTSVTVGTPSSPEPVVAAPAQTPAPTGVYPAMPTAGIYQPDNTMLYNYPFISVPGGPPAPLDVCRIWGAECGTPAADAFCALMDATRPFAVTTEGYPNIGYTAVIGTGQRCDGSYCSGFRSIVCGTQR